MLYRMPPISLCALAKSEDRLANPMIAIESFVPLLLATHGAILLFWLGNTQPWQWLILGGLLVLGSLRLSGWYEMAPLSYGRAAYILLATWLLMYSTGGVASTFMLWNFVLVVVYSIILPFPYAPLLPPVVAAGYLLLLLFGPQASLSFVTSFSRVFLLCFIGWLTYLLGASLQRQTQTYWQAAEQLAKEQSQLRVQIDFNQAVLDSLSAHIAVLDQGGVIITVNQAWQRFAAWNGGTAEQTGVGANYLAICEYATGEDAAEAPTIAARIRDVMAGRIDHFSLEYACHSPTEQRWFLFNVVPLVGGAGGAVVSHTNITQRKAAEIALRQSETYNRALLTAIPDAIGRFHQDGTCFDMRAPSNFEMTVPPAIAIGKKLTEYLPPAVAQQTMDAIAQALATGEVQALDYQLADKHEIQVRETRIVPYTQDEVITITRDITSRRLTEEALRKSEARNRALLEAIPDAILRIHRDGTYLDIKAPRTFNTVRPVNELVGKKQHDVLPPPVADRVTHYNQQALATGKLQTFEYELVVNGKPSVRESRVVPVAEDEVIVIVRDVTEQRQTQALLRRERDFAQSLIETAQVIILVLDTQGQIVRFNPYLTEISGYRLEEVQGKEWFATFLPARDRQPIRQRFAQALAGSPTRGNVNTMVTKAGREVEIEWFDKTLQDADGQIIGLLAIGQDITARRAMERELRTSEARLRALLEAIPDAMVRLHRDGTYLDVKASPDFVLAKLIEPLIGKKVQDMVEPQLAQRLLAVAQQALAKGECQIFEFELQVGEEQKIREGRAVPAGADEVIFIIRDITARKQAEAVLRQSEERYRILAEVSPDAILVNVDGRYVYANSAAARILGAKDPQEILGRSPWEFLAPEDHGVVRERIRGVLEEQRPAPPLEFLVRRLDGAQIYVEVAVAPSIWNGRPCVQVVQRDITGRKQSEAEQARLHAEVIQQRAQLRALTARLAEVQEEERKALARELHDQVGQNLSTLGLQLKILQTQLETQLPETGLTLPLLTDTQALVKQITEQVRNVMAELRPPQLDDFGLPAALAWYATRVAQRAGFRVQFSGEETMVRLPANVENGLFRIAQEAVTNIMKHAQATSVAINLVADAHAVTLTITDDGRGFDPTGLSSPSRRAGWGLLSMRERVEALGGRFTIDSRPGQGARIQIVIPHQLSLTNDT